MPCGMPVGMPWGLVLGMPWGMPVGCLGGCLGDAFGDALGDALGGALGGALGDVSGPVGPDPAKQTHFAYVKRRFIRGSRNSPANPADPPEAASGPQLATPLSRTGGQDDVSLKETPSN